MSLSTRIITLTAAVLLAAVVTAPALAEQAPPAPGDETQLIAVLQSDAPLFDKAKACQRLAVIGTKKSVPVLAGLLADPELSHYARTGLEPIPDASVDDALREAMGQVKGDLLAGVIGSIGMRRDAKAVDDLKKLLGDSDPGVAAAAAWALGRIAAPEAVAALKAALAGPAPLRPAAGDACLTAADVLIAQGKQADAVALYDAMREADLPKYLEVAAITGAIRARGDDGLPLLVELLQSEDQDLFRVGLDMAHELSGGGVTEALVAEFSSPRTSEMRRSLIAAVLGDRGDKAALPVVLEAARSAPADVRLTAVRTLAVLGDAQALPVLLEAAQGEGELADAARDSLARLSGEEIDAALEKMLGQSKGPKLVVIETVGRRGIASAVPALLKLADSSDAETSQAAIEALGRTVDLDNLKGLLVRLVEPKSAEAAAAAKESLRKACLRMPDRDATAAILLGGMSGASPAAKADLLDLLGVVGGQKALEGVAAAAAGGDEAAQDAATRVLGEWMSPDAAPLLLELATSGNEKFRVRSLRGYIRIPRQLDVPDGERITMCRQALLAATRDDEKRLVLEVLGRYPSADSLAVAATLLDDANLKQAAAEVAVDIAQKAKDAPPAAVAEAMKKAAAATGDAELAGRANGIQRRAERSLREK
jgi:HEAT repeat protein